MFCILFKKKGEYPLTFGPYQTYEAAHDDLCRLPPVNVLEYKFIQPLTTVSDEDCVWPNRKPRVKPRTPSWPLGQQ